MSEKQFFVTQYAAIFDKENRILLMRDAKDAYIKGKWIFPGGHIDADRNAMDALAREIKEETSMKLRAAWVFHTAIKRYLDGNWRYVVYYVCQTKGKVKLSEEHDAFEWADMEKAKKMQFRDREEKAIILDMIKRKEAGK